MAEGSLILVGGLLDAVRNLAAERRSVILAEPLGSCADLSATIMQPLKVEAGLGLSILPYTVLVDPVQLKDMLDSGEAGPDTNAVYILQKQLACWSHKGHSGIRTGQYSGKRYRAQGYGYAHNPGQSRQR